MCTPVKGPSDAHSAFPLAFLRLLLRAYALSVACLSLVEAVALEVRGLILLLLLLLLRHYYYEVHSLS